MEHTLRGSVEVWESQSQPYKILKLAYHKTIYINVNNAEKLSDCNRINVLYECALIFLKKRLKSISISYRKQVHNPENV